MYKIPTEKRQYFSIEEYRECGLQKPGGITIINGGRDIGKTTGTLINDLMKCSASEQLMFIRNTEKEIDKYRESFNSDYRGRFIMTKSGIYLAESKTWIEKKTGEQKTTYSKGECIGYVAALSGVDGWRSANFQNIKYIYADEYNQIGNTLNVEKFLTLWTSVLRKKQDVYTTIVGNRDDVAAELLIELGVEILIPEDFKGDWVVELLPDDKDFKDKAYFIDLDDDRYEVNNVPTIWKAIGRKSDKMGTYYDRGYKCYDNVDCKKLPKSTMEKVTWQFSYNYEDITIIVGEAAGIIVCHWDKDLEYTPKMKLASVAFCAKNKGYVPLENNMDWPYHLLTKAMREKQIVYTSLVAKTEVNDIVNTLAYEINKRGGFTL